MKNNHTADADGMFWIPEGEPNQDLSVEHLVWCRRINPEISKHFQYTVKYRPGLGVEHMLVFRPCAL